MTKSYLKYIALMAAGLAMTGNARSGRAYEIEPVEPVKAPIPAGCKEYTFFGVTVVAISEKSAYKKAKRKAGIK